MSVVLEYQLQNRGVCSILKITLTLVSLKNISWVAKSSMQKSENAKIKTDFCVLDSATLNDILHTKNLWNFPD